MLSVRINICTYIVVSYVTIRTFNHEDIKNELIIKNKIMIA
jgi:hypothetical protein